MTSAPGGGTTASVWKLSHGPGETMPGSLVRTVVQPTSGRAKWYTAPPNVSAKACAPKHTPKMGTLHSCASRSSACSARYHCCWQARRTDSTAPSTTTTSGRSGVASTIERAWTRSARYRSTATPFRSNTSAIVPNGASSSCCSTRARTAVQSTKRRAGQSSRTSTMRCGRVTNQNTAAASSGRAMPKVRPTRHGNTIGSCV